METKLECEIFLKADSSKYDLLKGLSESLKIPNESIGDSFAESKDYSIAIHSNIGTHAPSYYFDNNIRSNFWDYFISYVSKNINKEEDIKTIESILRYFWNKNIPAATFSSVDDLLPNNGGNDIKKVFWKDTAAIYR